MLDSLRPEKAGDLEEEGCHQPVRDWKDQVEDFLTELHTLRPATENIDQRYFDGQQVLFANEAERLVQLVTLVEQLIDVYNEALASRLEGQQRLLREEGPRDRHSG